jgi:hypothetical protein
MASNTRLAVGLMSMLVCGSVFAGGTENPAPVEPPAQERAPVMPAPAAPMVTPPITIHLAPPAPVAPPAKPLEKPASPAAVNYYMGMGLGPTHFSRSSVPGYSDCGFDNHDTGYKFFAGRKLGGPFAIEAGYVNLGGMSATGCKAPAVATAEEDDCGPGLRAEGKKDDDKHTTIPGKTVNQDLHVHGLTLEGVISAPVFSRHLSAFAKAGAFIWRSRSDGDLGSHHASGTSPVYGVGLEYGFAKTSAVRLEVERYDHAGETADQTHPDVNMASVSYLRRF